MSMFLPVAVCQSFFTAGFEISEFYRYISHVRFLQFPRFRDFEISQLRFRDFEISRRFPDCHHQNGEGQSVVTPTRKSFLLTMKTTTDGFRAFLLLHRRKRNNSLKSFHRLINQQVLMFCCFCVVRSTFALATTTTTTSISTLRRGRTHDTQTHPHNRTSFGPYIHTYTQHTRGRASLVGRRIVCVFGKSPAVALF